MAKQELNNAVTDLLGGQKPEATKPVKHDARSRNKKTLPIDKNTAGYEGAYLFVNTELYNKIRYIAYEENLTLKKVLEEAMKLAVEQYEADHGTIKLKPAKQGDAEALFRK